MKRKESITDHESKVQMKLTQRVTSLYFFLRARASCMMWRDVTTWITWAVNEKKILRHSVSKGSVIEHGTYKRLATENTKNCLHMISLLLAVTMSTNCFMEMNEWTNDVAPMMSVTACHAIHCYVIFNREIVRGWGELPHERSGMVVVSLWSINQMLVSLRVFKTKRHYF